MEKVSPSIEEVEAMRSSAPAGPVSMINLLKFKGENGRDAYRRYAAAGTRACEAVGAVGKALFSGDAGPDVSNDADWDFVIVVEWENVDAIADVLTHPIYQEEAIPLRDEALSRSLFMVSFPSGFTKIWETGNTDQ